MDGDSAMNRPAVGEMGKSLRLAERTVLWIDSMNGSRAEIKATGMQMRDLRKGHEGACLSMPACHSDIHLCLLWH